MTSNKCCVSGCGRDIHSKGACARHYQRALKNGEEAPQEAAIRKYGYLKKLGINAKHPIYVAWCSLRQRCTAINRKDYKHYGGRGITYCKEWEDFEAFFFDMSPTWHHELTLDRRDVNGNYTPDNCRWITWSEQNLNKRKK